MNPTFTFSCPVTHGFHARPATQWVDVASQFEADITLTNERTSASVNAKSVLAIVSADIRLDDACIIEAAGPDAPDAIAALCNFVRDTLPTIDEPENDESGDLHLALPRSFIETGASWITGVPVSHGIGHGRVLNVSAMGLPKPPKDAHVGTPEQELERLHNALKIVRKAFVSYLAAAVTEAQQEILAAHLAILNDVGLISRVEEAIHAGASAASAVASTVHGFAESLRAADTALIRERAMDVEDVGRRLLEELGVASTEDVVIRLEQPTIIVADNLTPRQLLSTDRTMLSGIILEHAGTTSHTVILARSLRIPALVGMKNACRVMTAGDDVIVDAHLGLAVRKPAAEVLRYYTREERKHERRRERLVRLAHHDATTIDGEPIEVSVNISTTADIDPDMLKLANGVGLFRTETVFADHEDAPTEEEQYEVYCRAIAAADGERVIIRLYDVGVDKPLPYFLLPPEDNPALGCRGVRNYALHLDLVHAQLRAILRASATGPVGLMVPMVSCVEEIAQVKAWIAEAQAALTEAGQPYDENIQIGVMVEVPILTYALDEVCEMVDFLSIGTNDLAQYSAAADRCNSATAPLAEVRSPAFLRMLRTIVDKAHAHGREVGMCGDMASQIENIPLLVGLGLDAISVIGSDIVDIKIAVGRRNAADCRKCLDQTLACKMTGEVALSLEECPLHPAAEGMLSLGLTAVDVDCENKAEVIKHLIDEMFVHERTDNPRRLEQAVWQREDEGTTGLGHGFAVPHCRSGAVLASSVVVARLRSPVDWGAIDDQPVRFVILLAMSEADQQDRHMAVFSTIARRLMHEDFRAGLMDAPDATALHRFLKEQLAAVIGDDPSS